MTRPKVIANPEDIISKVGETGYREIISGKEFLMFQFRASLKPDGVECSNRRLSKTPDPTWIKINEILSTVFSTAIGQQPQELMSVFPLETELIRLSIYARLGEDGDPEWGTDIKVAPVTSLIAIVPAMERGIMQAIDGMMAGGI